MSTIDRKETTTIKVDTVNIEKSKLHNFNKRERGSSHFFQNDEVETFNTPFGQLHSYYWLFQKMCQPCD